MKKIFGCIGLLVLLAFQKAGAQQAVLSIDSTTVQIAPNDSLYFNDSISYSFNIANSGNAVYNGAVIINYQINNGNVFVDSIGLGQVIFPGNSISYSNSFPFSPNRYSTGDNIVVIWPTGIAGAGIGDSVIVHVFGLGYMGIVNPKSQSEFLLIYDHNLQFIKLICPAGKSDYHVSMCDMLGKTIFETNHFLDGEIPTHDLMVGIYIISITDNEGNSTSLKLLKL